MSECNCKKDKCLSPAVLQINNHDCPTVFHKVTFPAAMGDDETNPPRNGQYRNVLLVYEANGHVYMFSSDGIPTLISDGSRGVDDYNELANKPSIDGHELVGDSSLDDIGVTDAIEDALEDYTPTSELAEVAFTGDYNDLENTPPKTFARFYMLNPSVGNAAPIYHDYGRTDQVTLAQFTDAIASGPVQIYMEYDGHTFRIYYVDQMDAFIPDPPMAIGTLYVSFGLRDQYGLGVRRFLWYEPDTAPIFDGYDPNQSDWNQPNPTDSSYIKNKPNLATVATSGSYNDLSNKPTIPAAQVNSDWNASSGVAQILNKPTLAAVATSGNYNDLSNKPTIPAAQVNSDWNAASGVAQILNKPSLATVATSGSYNDLTDKPTIPTVNDATLTITQNGTSAGTFTANASSNTTISLTDTTYSDFSGATPSVAGASGLVPAPTAGDEDKALKGDGTWSVVGDVVELFISSQPNSLSTPFEIYKSDGSTPITHSEMCELFIPSNKKTVVLHDTTSYDGVYPVIEFCYDTTEFYIFDAVYNSIYYIASAPGGGNTEFSITRTDLQKKLTAGSNITISGDTISASAELVEMSYGESNAWAKFIAAYNAHSIVYCRASSAANPASGSQTRKAFMAYVNNATNPTSVEFQYVRSVSSKTASQPVDQVFVYTLTSTNGGTWTVTTRDMGPKLAAGTNTTVSYSNGTYTVSATDMPTRTVLYNNASGTNTDFTTTAAMSGYDAVEITYRDGNQNYETKTVPGSASSFVLDISHPGADSTVYWYVSRFLVSGTSVTVGANNTRKAITASGVTSTSAQDIYVTGVVGINY